jgi:hypothetical protein
MEQEWQGYIGDILSSKKRYVDSKKTIIVAGERLFEMSVRTEDQVVTWTENKEGDMLSVRRDIK